MIDAPYQYVDEKALVLAALQWLLIMGLNSPLILEDRWTDQGVLPDHVWRRAEQIFRNFL